nr:immunoglobulin heavy chain junction region [Mus musculus]
CARGDYDWYFDVW